MKPPPRWLDKLLTWLVAPHLREEVLGDMHERYYRRMQQLGETKARQRYGREVLAYVRPSIIKRKPSGRYVSPPAYREYPSTSVFNINMIRNYLTIAFRNLVKNRVYSFINIFGLATGMAVAMLIGLWMYDELSYDKYHKNYDRIAQLWQFVKFDVEKSSYAVLPIPLAGELRNKYPDFESVSLAVSREGVLDAAGDRKFTKTGKYVEPVFTKMMSVNMLAGTDAGLNDVNSILLSESTAASFFGSANPINRLIKLNNKRSLRVTGVYEDFPSNSTFSDISFLAPWKLFVATDAGAKDSQDKWDNNDYQIFAQLKAGADFEQVSAKIKDIRMKRDNPPGYKPEFFLHPMHKWHLYSDFKDGVNTGGLIVFVWLFGIIGSFVLLLACINFMNLSTARSEKRAKEVGIRKAIGSVRSQLISQFFSESLLLALLAFTLSFAFVWFALPFFNQVADKKMAILWSDPWFWLSGLGFTLLTGLIAGSYPAFYLSSFQPIKVLKGAFRAGRFATVPRKVLVAFQFTISVTLIIGTIIVFRQIEHAKDRPVGYNRGGLIEVKINTPELQGHYESLRSDLLNTGGVSEMAESNASVTVQTGGVANISWRGQATDLRPLLISNRITHDYGKTVGWRLLAGRDFSRDFSTDSAAVILNETAAKLMGFKNPVGEIIAWGPVKYKVIGTVRDMIKESPFKPVQPSFFVLNYEATNVIHIKLAPELPARESLAKVEQVFKTYNPAVPFDYTFVDDAYAEKFGHEERIGKLAGIFAGLAILISCLGLFGLASFMAEQRTKEIGIRKVLGASVFTVWQLLSKEFVILVTVAFCIAAPIAYYVLANWLQNYEYRTELSWWIFAAAGVGLLLITIFVVSFHALKAAMANPVRSLRTE